RLVADDVARTPDGVAEAERLLLTDADHLAAIRIGAFEHIEALALGLECRLELETDVEIIDQGRLAAPGDEDQLLDPRLARLVDPVLDQRPVDDRDHLLGDALGGGEEAGAETSNGEDRLANSLLHSGSWSRSRRGRGGNVRRRRAGGQRR